MLRKGTVRTHQPEHLEDDENELLLFHPDRPDEAILVDSLPKQVKKVLGGPAPY